MIAVKAHFDGKVIVPEEPIDLPKDRSLMVHIEVVPDRKREPRKATVLDWLEQNAVDDESVPTDLSYQHDHYLYGAPKKPKPHA